MPAATSETPASPDSFDRLPWGTHLCHLYRGDAELLSAAVPFIRAGLRNRERCLWVTSDPALLRDRVSGRSDELGSLLAGGEIEIVLQQSWRRDASQRCRDAIAAGFRGLRVAGDTTCLGTEPVSGQVIALCSYPIEGCTSRGLLDLLQAHPQTLVREGPGWTHVDTGILWMREDVISLVSHELKTPLASLRLRIDGLLRRLRAGALEPGEIDNRLSKALEQCDRLDGLVNNLLEVSRASSGKLVVVLESGDLGSIVVETVERFSEEFAHRGASLTVAAEPIPGHWDRIRVERVVTNLVANALRHAPRSPVEVRAYRREGGASIEVRDHGPGIPRELMETIFERCAPLGPRQGSGGLGIGLWIVREIVAALGGTFAVSSEIGRGCTCTVNLPPSLDTSGGARGQA